ncbi:tape measure protein [Actinomyces succiniciruminis]|uniref:Phage tape measure protein n=1 Tax=Actinomyces succiniciruminis TaxID=1522002 RepID=A0A1L7R9T7_9ACTO|nr:tape measure protein [Actinomyces succiniciruminis]CED90625.1 Phage tape measure protein [Actinomyces succiniciruminis]
MAYQAGSVFVDVVPSLKGFGKRVTAEVTSSMGGAANKAATTFSSDFRKTASSLGTDVSNDLSDSLGKSTPRLRREAEAAAAAVTSAQEAVTKASKKVEEARAGEVTASEKVTKAEEALAEARASGDEAAIAKAEQNLTKAREGAAAADQKADKAAAELTRARSTLEEATAKAATAQEALSKRTAETTSSVESLRRTAASGVELVKAGAARDLDGVRSALAGVRTGLGELRTQAASGDTALGRLSQSAATVKAALGQMASAGISGLKQVSSIAGQAVKALAQTAASAAGAVATLVGGIAIKGGISRALSIEDAQAKLKALGHDADSVSSIMDSALASVQGTAYGLGDAATVAASAVASGVKQGEQLTSYLSSIADIATISGDSLENVGLVFNQVVSKGKVQTQDMYQLANRGIPIFQWLAEESGVTLEQIQSDISAGLVSSDDFLKAVQKNSAGAALASADTVRGAVSNTYAALGRLGAAAFEPIMPAIRSSLGGVIEVADQVTTLVKPVLESIGATLSEKVAGVVERIKETAGPFVESLGEKLSGAKEALDGIGSGSLVSTLLPALGAGAGLLSQWASGIPVINKLIPSMSGPVGVVAGLIASMVATSPELRDALGGAFEAIGSVLGDLAEPAKTVLSTIGDLTAVLGDSLAQAITAITPSLTSLAQTVLPVISDVLAILGPALVDVAATLGDALVAALPTLADLLADVAQVVLPVLPGLLDGLLSVGLPLLEWVVGLASAILDNEAAVGIIVGALVTWKTTITAIKIATTAWSIAQGLLNVALNANPIGLVIIALTALAAGIAVAWQKSETFRTVVTTAFEAVKGAISTVVDWVTGTVVPAVQGFWENTVKPVIEKVKSAISTVAEFISGTVAPAIQTAIDTIGNIFSWLYNTIVKPVWTAIRTIIQIVSTAIAIVVAAVVVVVRDQLGKIFTWLYNNVVKPVWDGIKTAITGAWNSIKTVLMALRNFISGTLGPIFTWLRDTVVKPVWNTIKTVISSVANVLTNTILPKIKFFATSVKTAFTTLRDAVKTAMNKIKEYAAKPVNFVIKTVYTNGIKKAFDSIASKVGLSLRMPTVTAIPGYATGGVFQTMTPGYTPGKDVYTFYSPDGGGAIRLSGGEGIIRPDALRALGGKRWLDAVNASRGAGLATVGDTGSRRGQVAFAEGGIWGSIKSGFDSTKNWLKDTASAVSDILADPLGAIANLVTKPAQALLNTMESNMWAQIIKAMPGKWFDSIAQWFKRGSDGVTSTGGLPGQARKYLGTPYVWGGSSIPPGLDCSGLVYYSAKTLGWNWPRLTAAGYQSHAKSVAWDKKTAGDLLFWGSPAYHVAIYAGGGKMLEEPHPGGSAREIAIWGSPTVGRIGKTFDNGGVLPPGLTAAINATGGPEAILTRHQWDTLTALADRGTDLAGALDGTDVRLVINDRTALDSHIETVATSAARRRAALTGRSR